MKPLRTAPDFIALHDALENIGDIIIKFIVPLIDKKQELKQDFSWEGKRELIVYHRIVGHQLLRLQEAMTTLAYSLARKVKIQRHRYAEIADQLMNLERCIKCIGLPV